MGQTWCKMLCKNKPQPCVYASQNNHVEFFKNACKHTNINDICAQAAQGGNLECLKYAHEHGFPFDDRVVITAIVYRNFECLKYAHENGAPMPRYIVDQAFYMFMQPYNKKIVKYLHEQTNIVSIRISYYMASFDNLEGLQYIYNIGIPFSRDTCLIA